jgi:16S rRNA C967 or C1407 C5-methylase (RsmB/RsmF family)
MIYLVTRQKQIFETFAVEAESKKEAQAKVEDTSVPIEISNLSYPLHVQSSFDQYEDYQDWMHDNCPDYWDEDDWERMLIR